MTPFTVMVAAFGAAVAAGVTASRTENKRLEAAMNGAFATAALVILACVAIGLWQAWSPWELRLVRK